MKKTKVVLITVATSCLILASACGQNAHVTRRTPLPGLPGTETKASTITPGTVSIAMSDATQQTCPKSGEGVILKKFVDKNGNGTMDADEAPLESKTVCSGAVGARGETPTLPPTLLAITDATTDQCAEGGKVVEAYIDLLPNTKKDPQEPALTTGLICNGDRGDGTKFTVTDATAVGCPSSKGILVAITSSTAGAPPPNPSSMKFCEGPYQVTAIAPKLAKRDAIKSEGECKFGGEVLELYYDADGNGRKDPLEFIASSVKFCKTDPAGNVVVAVLSAEDRATIDQLKLSWAGVMQLKSEFDAGVKHVDEMTGKATSAAEAAAHSETNAKGSADAAKLSEDAAKLSADAAKLSADAASQSATNAQISADASKVSADAAKVSQDAGVQAVTEAKTSAEAARVSADAAKVSENAAKLSQDAAAQSVTDAKVHADAAQVSAEASKVSADAAKVSQDAAAGSATAAAGSATAAASSATAAEGFKSAAEQARDAAAESVKQAEAIKVAADEQMKAKLADAQGLVDQAKAHRDAAELASQAAEGHRKAAEAAKDAAATAQTALDSARAELEKLRDLAIARADELAASLELLKNAPRTIDEASQKALADLTQKVTDLRTELGKDVDGHKSAIQTVVDAGVATLNARMAELEVKAGKIQEDIDAKIAIAKNDAAKAAEDAAKAKDDAAAALGQIAAAVTAGKDEIAATAEARKKDIQELVAPLAGMVDEVRRLAEEVRAKSVSLPEELKGYVAAAKTYFEQAEAARAQIPVTIEELTRKLREANAADIDAVKKTFDELKTQTEASGAQRDAALRQLLTDLRTDAERRLLSIEQKTAGMDGLQAAIDKLQADIEGRLKKLEERDIAAAAPPPPVEQTCDVTRTLTDVSKIDAAVAAGLALPYDRQNVGIRDYGSPGDRVPFLGDTMQIRLNRQELFQINTTGLAKLPASELVEGSLKASMKLVLTKNMKDQIPYDYTEVLCTLGEKRACSGERYKDSNFSKFIVDSFWQPIGDVATSVFSDKLKADDKAEVRVFDLPGAAGVKYRAFKRTVELELGEAFKGQADAYSVIYGQDGAPKPLLQFVIADDIRLYDVSLTVSYKTKSCAQR